MEFSQGGKRAEILAIPLDAVRQRRYELISLNITASVK
jgi:hypothetical protein